jgi:hypothetical protein
LPAERWEAVRIPALVMVGGKSPACLHHGMRALAEALANGIYEVVEGQTHRVKAKGLAPSLAAFFGAHGENCGRPETP